MGPRTMTWSRSKLGVAMLVLTEGVFFFMLLLAFVYFREGVKPNPSAGITGIYTLCLLASSVTIWRAQRFVTAGLGTIFLAGQTTEIFRLSRSGIGMSQTLSGTAFFTLAGVHAIHMLAGIVLLAILPAAALEALALYWHFGVFAWLVIFVVVYLWAFL